MKNKSCPNCGAFFQTDAIRCGTCNYVAETTKDEWKPANMGKQGGQRKANRSGKKGSFYERQNG
jgi:uncharacterized Zn finger protein (UPF0148 family)